MSLIQKRSRDWVQEDCCRRLSESQIPRLAGVACAGERIISQASSVLCRGQHYQKRDLLQSNTLPDATNRVSFALERSSENIAFETERKARLDIRRAYVVKLRFLPILVTRTLISGLINDRERKEDYEVCSCLSAHGTRTEIKYHFRARIQQRTLRRG